MIERIKSTVEAFSLVPRAIGSLAWRVVECSADNFEQWYSRELNGFCDDSNHGRPENRPCMTEEELDEASSNSV